MKLLVLLSPFSQSYSTKLMKSHCADCTVTVPKHLHMQTGGIWMEAWLEHQVSCRQLRKCFFFVVHIHSVTFQTYSNTREDNSQTSK
ncbi:putative signal peptide protein [Puccinia sorghi]|uniref:Putative signal peptide protein n=1 Tax=Puccinia sorghi TaxID=27349 RepID=A0A0L6VK64_9BASI|nr:putative signal peptide protein [Puccinia sorghi]